MLKVGGFGKHSIIKGWTFHRSKPLNVDLIQQYPEKPVHSQHLL